MTDEPTFACGLSMVEWLRHHVGRRYHAAADRIEELEALTESTGDGETIHGEFIKAEPITDEPTVKRYRKKPVVIEAVELTSENLYEVEEWCGGRSGWQAKGDGWVIAIETLEGRMVAVLGDFIIKGVAGEFYPCKPDIFAQTYEQVSDD